MMLRKTAAFIALLLVIAGSHAAQIYRWTDESGGTHFSNRVPAAEKATAEPVDLKSAPVSIVHGQKAQVARLAKVYEKEAETKEAEAENGKTKPTVIFVTSAMPALPANAAYAAGTSNQCQEQWRRYYESHACFNQFRLANGAVRAQAYAYCTEVKEPEPCE